MVKIYVIDVKSFRRKIKRNLLSKDTLSLVFKFSLFAAASIFTGICAVSTQIEPFHGDINANIRPDDYTTLFKDMSEELKNFPKNI